MEVVGRDGDAYLVTDGPIGAIVQPGQKPLILAVASLLAHREFDDFTGSIPGGAPDGLAEAMAERRREWERTSTGGAAP